MAPGEGQSEGQGSIQGGKGPQAGDSQKRRLPSRTGAVAGTSSVSLGHYKDPSAFTAPYIANVSD